LVSGRYERGSMLIRSNRAVGDWGTVFGDAVVATAIADHLLHHPWLQLGRSPCCQRDQPMTSPDPFLVSLDNSDDHFSIGFVPTAQFLCANLFLITDRPAQDPKITPPRVTSGLGELGAVVRTQQ
jgi:hypothetical protein